MYADRSCGKGIHAPFFHHAIVFLYNIINMPPELYIKIFEHCHMTIQTCASTRDTTHAHTHTYTHACGYIVKIILSFATGQALPWPTYTRLHILVSAIFVHVCMHPVADASGKGNGGTPPSNHHRGKSCLANEY